MAETNEERRIYKEVAKQAQAMSDAQLSCRAGNHSFTKPLTAGRMRGGFFEEMACRNGCGNVRYREMTTFGLITVSRIKYDRTYLLKDVGRLTTYTKGALRVANIERVIERL